MPPKSRPPQASPLRRWLSRLAWLVLAIVAGFYAFACFRLWRDQEQLLFPGGGPAITECGDMLKLGYVPRRVDTGTEVVRYLWKAGKRAKGTLLFFHGNGGSICFRSDHAEHLRSDDWNVAMAEYPGYGGEGVAGEAAILKNALAAFDVVQAEGKGLPVVLMGESLGSGPATYVASIRPAAGLILHTLYPSLTAVGAHAFHHLLPIGLLIRHPMKAERWAPGVRCPVLALHGDADTLIPLSLGREQASHFQTLDFVTVPGAGHNDLAWKDAGLYWGKIIRFCERSFQRA